MLYSLLILTAVASTSFAWTNHRSTISIVLAGRSSTTLFALLPADYQERGNNIILEAGRQCGATNDQLKIEWKSGRIVVTVEGDVYVSNSDSSSSSEQQLDVTFDTNDEDDDEDEEEMYSDSEEDADEEEYDDDDEKDDDEEYNVEAEYNQDDVVSQSHVTSEGNNIVVDDEIDPEGNDDTEGIQSRGVDVAALARAINAALDDDGIGLAIAEEHEIEVTTPGASDELQGPVMFKAYKGFDVLVTFMDPKKKSAKTIEGKLHERTSEFTIINIKGRMKKLKNQMLVSVKLPKALKEKGAR